jgi:hypothetical protein
VNYGEGGLIRPPSIPASGHALFQKLAVSEVSYGHIPSNIALSLSMDASLASTVPAVGIKGWLGLFRSGLRRSNRLRRVAWFGDFNLPA